MASVLIVDDDPIFHEPLAFYIQEIGHTCDVAETFTQGERIAGENAYDLIFLDIVLPDANGLEQIGRLKGLASSPEIIVITGKGDLASAEQALTNGAWDYLEKPPSYRHLRLLMERSLQYRTQKMKFAQTRMLQRDAIIGNDPALRQCLEVIARAAVTEGSVLITGETGTGKELMAQAVHLSSARAKGKLVTVDCTNIPPSLAETLLFGHVKGTFTGAVHNREGLIQQALGGTLFLDEVGDLHPTVQKSFLAVLQKKTFRPLGAKHAKSSDFRVVASTNKDLNHLIDQKQFRKDLYYRLAGFHVQLPPLRERTGDIKRLVYHYVAKICDDLGIHSKGLSKDFVTHFTDYEWPGNIRELVNVLHAGIANAMNASVLYPHHLPVEMRLHIRKKSLQDRSTAPENGRPVNIRFNPDRFPSLNAFRKLTDALYLDKLIELADGSARRACEMSEVSRSGLYHLLQKHGKKMKA